MRVVAIWVIGLVACSRPDPADPITGCESCGSGALRAGVMLPNESALVAAGSNGVIAYAGDSSLAWLGSDFTVGDSTTFDPAPGASAGSIAHVVADAANAIYVDYSSHDDIDEYTSLIGLDADHHQMFRLEQLSGDLAIAGDPAAGLTVYKSGVPAGDANPNAVTAIHTSDASVAWTVGLISSPQQSHVSLVAAPDGTVVLAGVFVALSLGGTMNPVDGTVIAAFDPATGDAEWDVTISNGNANVPALATGPGGEIAVALDLPAGSGPITIADQTLTPSADDAALVALLEPTGELRWAQLVSFGASSLVTDGNVVVVTPAGAFAQVSATGIDWQQALTGDGQHSAAVLALAGSHVLASVVTDAGADGQASLVDGDVTVPGQGTVIADVVH